MEKPHKKLEAWKQSMDLVTEIYKTTKEFPTQEIYGITNQVRRAAVSAPSNIAEGAARQTKKEFRNFLHVAQGSLSELDTRIEIASRYRPQLSKEPR
jgi:four helix bundle protein